MTVGAYLKKDTIEIVKPWKYLKIFFLERPTKEFLNIYSSPNYEFIDYKEVMLEFTKNIWNDKEARVILLKNYAHIDKFYNF